MHHPNVAKELGTEEKFKDAADTYVTLKGQETRPAYDETGKRPSGQEFEPPLQWEHGLGGRVVVMALKTST